MNQQQKDELWQKLCEMAEQANKPKTKTQKRKEAKRAKAQARAPKLETSEEMDTGKPDYSFLYNSKWRTVELVLYVFEQRCSCCGTIHPFPNSKVLVHRKHETLGSHFCEPQQWNRELSGLPRRIEYVAERSQFCPECFADSQINTLQLELNLEDTH